MAKSFMRQTDTHVYMCSHCCVVVTTVVLLVKWQSAPAVVVPSFWGYLLYRVQQRVLPVHVLTYG